MPDMPDLPAKTIDKMMRGELNFFSLIDALNTPDTITQANESVRQLIEKVRLVPEGNTLNIELFW